MELKVLRLGDNGNATIGAFYINGILRCMTIEDEEREVKVKAETRVPEGKYDVLLRNVGTTSDRYAKSYPDMHKGMLCIHNAPDWKLVTPTMSFQWILIHKGNLESHSAGCLLLNYAADTASYKGSRSGDAYVDIYPEIAEALVKGEKVTIEYVDVETGR